jgi:hypothetical protein
MAMTEKTKSDQGYSKVAHAYSKVTNMLSLGPNKCTGPLIHNEQQLISLHKQIRHLVSFFYLSCYT